MHTPARPGRALAGIVLFLALLSGCGEEAPAPGADEAPTPEHDWVQTLDPGTLTVHAGVSFERLVNDLEAGLHPDRHLFRGVLPCASCPGIRTLLTLVPEGSVYVLRQTWLEAEGGEDRTLTTVGRYAEEAGLPDHPELRVIRLDGEPGAEPVVRFAVLSNDTLRMLDREGRWIDSELDYEIVRVPSAP